MGMSTSFFTCGFKLSPNQKENTSKKLSLSNGSTITGASNHTPESNLIIGDNCTKPDSNNTDNTHNSSCQNNTSTVPWCQDMDIHEDNLEQVQVSSALELEVGSMKIAKPQFKTLLVYSKKDDQLEAWQTTLNKLGFQHDLACNEETALDNCNQHKYHLVIIENQSKKIDADSLCRNLRESSTCGFVTIVCVIARNQVDGISKTQELLHSGFDKIIGATCNLQDLEDELLQLEAGPLTLQVKHRQLCAECRPVSVCFTVEPSLLHWKKAIQGVFAAINHCHDLVQITDENFQIQFVNKMYEKVTGFEAGHVTGTNLAFYFENEKNEEDAWQRIQEEVTAGKDWDGTLYTKRNNETDLQLTVSVQPLTDEDGFVHQYVVVSQCPGNNSQFQDLYQAKRKNSHEYYRKASGAGDQLQMRRLSATSLFEVEASHRRTNSLARIHSMAVEAPITQIINLISIIKDGSQSGVSEVLDQILEILRNSELYAPTEFPNRSRDPMLTGFVEGLVTGTAAFSHRRASGGTGENLFGKTPPTVGLKTAANQHPSVMTFDPNIAKYLEGCDSWDYDILALERVTIKKPLVHLGMRTLGQFDACNVLECSQSTLHSWLVSIESHYQPCNPYHNSTHAADVLHATSYFLRKERVKTWMEPLDDIAVLLAAIIHDVDHPGRTNAFLVNSNDPLALLYNDTAVLESHHAAFSFKFTANNDACNIFKNLSNDTFRTLRQSMIDMVLATELSKHFEHVNKFISIVTKSSNNSQASDQEQGTTSGNRTSGALSPAATYELKVLIKRMLIKVADVINPARKTDLCVEWARRISEEYFSQTDEEKRRGLPVVMPHFDRKTCSLPKSQITFIDYFLMDMCEAWHEFCGLDEVMDNLNENYSYWQKLRNRGIMRLAELEDDSRLSDDDDPDAPNSTINPGDEESTPLADPESSTRVENHLS